MDCFPLIVLKIKGYVFFHKEIAEKADSLQAQLDAAAREMLG